MALNNAGIIYAAQALQQVLAYAQLHSGLAGPDGTTNIVISGRTPVSWIAPNNNGDFVLRTQINFTGGTPGDPVYSVTLWDMATDGTIYGEFALDGDTALASDGSYAVTALDFTGIFGGA